MKSVASVGFEAFLQAFSSACQNSFLWRRRLGGKTRSDVFGRAFSIPISLLDILMILGSLPFSGVTLTMFAAKSMSVHLRHRASPHFIPVSLSS